MISDALNRYDHGGYTEITDPSSNNNFTDEDESKQIIVHKTLSENSSMDVSKSEHNIITKNPAELSKYTITELKYKDHKKLSATEEVKSYFNIFYCGRNLLDQLEFTYQRAFMATPQG